MVGASLTLAKTWVRQSHRLGKRVNTSDCKGDTAASPYLDQCVQMMCHDDILPKESRRQVARSYHHAQKILPWDIVQNIAGPER